MKVLVTGSRGWKDKKAIRETLMNFQIAAGEMGDELQVVHGHCPQGADALADQVCNELGIKPIRVPADWNRHGKAAGFIRNQQMLDEHDDIELVLAFRAPGKSNGTDDMCKKAEKAGVHVIVIERHVSRNT